MTAIPIITSFIPLLIVGGAVWAIVSLRRSSTGAGANTGASVGRLFLYLVLLITMLLSAAGLSGLVAEGFAESPIDSEALAISLAMVIVALPVLGGLLRFVDRRMRSRRERGSPEWSGYLAIASTVTLVGAAVMAVDALDRLYRGEMGTAALGSVLAAAVWSLMWALHWVVLRKRYGVRGDVHRAAAALVAIVTLVVGSVEVLYHVFDRVYTEVFSDPLMETGGPGESLAFATLSVGAVLWLGLWLLDYRRGPRTALWHVLVLPFGALAGYVMAAVSGALVANAVLVWFVGDATAETAVRHFDHLPAQIAVVVVGCLAWGYHRLILGRGSVRSEATRSYEYLLAGAGLTTAVVGSSVLIAALLAVDGSGRVNSAIAGAVVLVLGGATWFAHWRRVSRAVAASAEAEYQATSRHIYVFAVFAASLLTAVVSVIVLLTIGLTDVLESRLSSATLDSASSSIAVAVSIFGVAWFHLRLYLAERGTWAGEEAPVVELRPRPRAITVVAPAGIELGGAFGLAPSATWRQVLRTDAIGVAELDLAELASELGESAGDLLVIVEADGSVDVIAVEGLDLPRSQAISALDHDLVV